MIHRHHQIMVHGWNETGLTPFKIVRTLDPKRRSNRTDSTNMSDNQVPKENQHLDITLPRRATPVTKKTTESSPYAYAWVLGGVQEDRMAYKGFLWTILISANLLRNLGSTADFWVHVRLSSQSNLTDLPSEDRRVLEALGVHIVLLEKLQKESFAELVYDKFLTINMTRYKRVMFLDADILPMTNLDYYFHLSDPDYNEIPTLLKPNFIMASREEPCNTGMFMIEPSQEAFEQYRDVVRRQKKRAQTMSYPYFDFKDGWGHSFEHGDYWEGIHKKGNRWKFHASHSDQGLMYYFVKYVRKEVSIAIGDRIQNWKQASVGDLPEIESDTHGLLEKYQGRLIRQQFLCDMSQEEALRRDADDNRWTCTPPYNSIAHFMGNTKPWRRKFDFRRDRDDSYRQFGPRYLWFKELNELSKKLDMGVDVKQWNKKYLDFMRDDVLGGKAEWKDQAYIFGIDARQ